jgi:NitT/TauT family transport system permease protein
MKIKILLGILFILLLWYFVILVGIISPLFLAYPHDVIIRLTSVLFEGQFWTDIGFSISRIFLALLFSCLIGIPLGLYLGYNKELKEVAEAFIDYFRSFPIIILLPFFVFFFGIGEASKVITATFAGCLFVVLNTMQGVANSKKERKQFIEVLANPTKFSVFRKIVFMEALPYIFIGLRVAISLILIVVLVSEMFFGSSAGMGYRIYQSQLGFDSSLMIIYILITGGIGYSLNRFFLFFERKMFHWKGK